jgi:FkbM family methyltransferase
MKISTQKKVQLARWISWFLIKLRGVFGLSPITRAYRHGVRWSLDLREGIDLAIFLGVYEPETIQTLSRIIKSGDVVLDIGANIGAITLPLALYVGDSGHVIAFEPTTWAYEKLKKNLSLNHQLSQRVKAEHMMLLETEQQAPDFVYSSWSLTAEEDDLTHPQHKGRLMTTNGVKVISLDQYLKENPVDKLDFIKLDVDGYELPVLKGAQKTISFYRPKIILEMAPHIQEEKHQFGELIEELKQNHYRLKDLRSGKVIPLNQHEIERRCPVGGGINVLAIPQS